MTEQITRIAEQDDLNLLTNISVELTKYFLANTDEDPYTTIPSISVAIAKIIIQEMKKY